MIKVYKSKGEWRSKITSKNNKIIGGSTEGYKNKKDCEQNLRDQYEALREYFNEDKLEPLPKHIVIPTKRNPIKEYGFWLLCGMLGGAGGVGGFFLFYHIANYFYNL